MTLEPGFRTELSAGAVCVTLTGSIGLADAYPIRDRISRLLPGPVVVNFSRVDHMADAALGILALWFAEVGPGQLRVAGLGRHGIAILRCFVPDPSLAA